MFYFFNVFFVCKKVVFELKNIGIFLFWEKLGFEKGVFIVLVIFLIFEWSFINVVFLLIVVGVK